MEPPLFDGAVHSTASHFSSAVRVLMDGAAGTPDWVLARSGFDRTRSAAIAAAIRSGWRTLLLCS